MSRRVAFLTLGCKVNQYDTSAMAELFRGAGWDVVDFRTEADAYVINTCAVTARSEAKSRQAAREVKRRAPQAVLVVTGCYPQAAEVAEEIRQATGADVILGTGNRGQVVAATEQAISEKKPVVAMAELAGLPFEEVQVSGGTRTRAVLKVQEGCDSRCSYCIVPSVRGPARSREPRAAVEEARRLLGSGYREIVLTGIQLGAYGRDLGLSEGLAWLVEQIAPLPGLCRLRLSSVEPMDISPTLLRTMAGHATVCPHLHIPLQSGSDRILASMHRPYTAARYLALLDEARSDLPILTVSTDVMVGFPGEREEDFSATMRVVEQAEFMRLHVFPFSPRPGTKAATMSGQVPSSIKEERSRCLRRLGSLLAMRFAARFLGQEVEVLLEGDGEMGWSGFTPHYVRVTITAAALPVPAAGSLVTVRVTGCDENGLQGELVGFEGLMAATAERYGK